jgi:murein DD-endopeptidase MepM/ murein hydrolase activator NlpD
MGFLGWLLLAAAALLLLSGRRGLSPVDTLKSVLDDKPLPVQKYIIDGGAGKAFGRTLPTGGGLQTLGAGGGFLRPVSAAVVSPYGMRGGRMHEGVDLASALGTPVLAAASGTVTAAEGGHGGYGNLVTVKHADGFESRYAHLQRIAVTRGAVVGAGQVIGYSGGAKGAPGAGNSSGPHLHFEIRRHGIPQDPLTYIQR